jgi:hypothetical protein
MKGHNTQAPNSTAATVTVGPECLPLSRCTKSPQKATFDFLLMQQPPTCDECVTTIQLCMLSPVTIELSSASELHVTLGAENK